MRNKITILKEAAGLVKDGDTLSMTTCGLDNAPMAFLRELIRSRRKGLAFAAVTGGGFNLDLPIGAGVVDRLEACYVSLDDLGPAPSFQRRLKNGSLRMKDNTCGVMYSMVQAGAMGVPFVPVRGLFGTDILKHRDDFKVVSNPFNEAEDIVLAPALRPDVAVFHGLAADKWGNVITPPQRDDLMLAQASRHVIVTVEEIVDGKLEPPPPSQGTFIPYIYVEAVVHVPHGAHPLGLWHRYDADTEHLKEYVVACLRGPKPLQQAKACQSEDGLAAYLDKYVYSVRSQSEYLVKVGVAVESRRAG